VLQIVSHDFAGTQFLHRLEDLVDVVVERQFVLEVYFEEVNQLLECDDVALDFEPFGQVRVDVGLRAQVLRVGVLLVGVVFVDLHVLVAFLLKLVVHHLPLDALDVHKNIAQFGLVFHPENVLTLFVDIHIYFHIHMAFVFKR